MGRPALVGLLVWALVVVALDGAVIARGNDDDTTPSARATTTTRASTTLASTTTTAPVDSTTTTLAASDSATSVPETTEATPTTTAPGSGGEVVVAHPQGDTPTTVSFHVDGHWQIRWHVADGKGVSATLDNDDNPSQGSFFVPMAPGDGSAGFVDGCNCTLHLTPNGSSYDVLVVDVDG